MNKAPFDESVVGEVLGDEAELSLHEVCSACHIPAEVVIKYMEYGVIEPTSHQQAMPQFRVSCITRILSAQRLESDLGVNRAGVALALDLIDELNELRERLKHYEKSFA